ncbi:MAG: glycosyltransferase family 8 protein [Clostridia bacterium]|nr:glycosyltransferase family 8 protein [Clostridia bacterium]
MLPIKEINNQEREVVPIFFAIDDRYIPFMGVCLQSITEHASKEICYDIKILYTNVSKENQERIMEFEKDNIKIEFVDVSNYINQIKDKLYTRDYFSNATYFRLFIPELYPQYHKAIYIDADTVLLEDIANLFHIDIGDNLIGGVNDGVIISGDVFKEYVEKVVGVSDWHHYFNAGVLLMNLEELRKFHFQDKFTYLLGGIKFPVAQDQDYLNRICKGRVQIIDCNWDVMPVNKAMYQDETKLKLIHYNLADKPWHNDNVSFEKYFWEYAKKTQFINDIMKIKASYTEADRLADIEMGKNLAALAQKESDCVGDDRKK